jgi:putative Mn2+ efflux pump MntP
MGLAELLLIAVGLSMDAFAISVCVGLSAAKRDIRKMLTVGLYFGVFQAAMPLAGYLAAFMFADYVSAYAHWVAFVLLGFLGIKMVRDSYKKDGCTDADDSGCEEAAESKWSAKPSHMLPLAVATSIDALAIGVFFAVSQINNIVTAVSVIGITTFVISVAGVQIGNLFGAKFRSKAQLAGGVIMILIGVKILIEHYM